MRIAALTILALAALPALSAGRPDAQPLAPPYSKMSRELLGAVRGIAGGSLPSRADSAAHSGKIRVIFFAADARALASLHADARALAPGARAWNGRIARFVSAEVTLLGLLDLSSRPCVTAAWRDDLLAVELDRTVPHLGVAPLHALGWRGQNARVAVIDTGVDSTHPALPNVIARRDLTCDSWEPGCCDPDDSFGHGTHMAGVIGSNDATYAGLAPGAGIISAKVLEGCSLSGWTSTTIAGVDWALAQGANVINMSLRDTQAGRFDGNSQLAKFADYVVSATGVTWVKSAGNSGAPCGDQTGHITSPADAYNVLTASWVDYEFTSLHPCSSSGYTDDQRDGAWDDRCAVRLAAPGTTVMSCSNNWETADDFLALTGSSVSAAHVSGLAALLWDFGYLSGLPRDPALLRAVMMNSARHLVRKDGSAWANAPDRPLDPEQGAGEIDAPAALLSYGNAGRWALLAVPQDSQGQPRWFAVDVTDAPTVIRATLCWDRHVTDYNASPPPCNDLDLALFRCPSGQSLAASVSRIDNVEHIWFPVAEAGRYWLQVFPNALPAGSEAAALACSHALTDAGDNPTVAMPSIRLTTPLNGSRVGGVVTIEAEAAAEAGIERVVFVIDGQTLCTDYTAPYQCQWDTTPQSVPDGLAAVSARAYDRCGQMAFAAAVVTVDNTTFDDVLKTDADWAAIEALARAGIVGGCRRQPPLFCPQAALTRGQVAKLLCLAAGKGPLDRPVPTFADVPKTSMFYAWIERFADAASWGGSRPTWGCRVGGTAGYYCPNAAVTREQIAAFLCRATGRPPDPLCFSPFADVCSCNPFCGYIRLIADPSWGPQGAPAQDCSCPPSSPPGARCYCPRSPITRAQAAGFIARAFSLPPP